MMILEDLEAERPIIFPGDPALAQPTREEFPKGADGDKAFKAASDAYDKNWEKYLETYDVSVLPVRDGEQLTVYWVGGLTERQVRVVESTRTTGDRLSMTLAYGMRRIDGLSVRKADGTLVPVQLERDSGPAGEHLTEKSMEYLRDSALRYYLWAEINRAGGLADVQKKASSSGNGSTIR